MNKLKTLKGAALVAATSLLPLSQAAMAEVTISGWVNEALIFTDDGASSDAVQTADNGATLGNRIAFNGSTEVSTGLTAGGEFIIEPGSLATQPLLNSTLTDNANNFAASVSTLSANIHVAGAWGKLTWGLQSMPTDNIAVLEDPSLTLWSSITPVFRGTQNTIQGLGAGATNSTWGSFLQCLATPGLQIGIDCNGPYRNGIRYDLPAFGPVTIAVGYANDDIYDIAAKWKGSLGRVKANLAVGYAINQGGGGAGGTEAENFQTQLGLMDPETGLFGSIAYQAEEADGGTTGGALVGDDTDAWWLKVGIKKQWFSPGPTSVSFDYGQYSDQFGTGAAAGAAARLGSGGAGIAATAATPNPGITGSEVERMGIEANQYFGSNLILYGRWEQLDLDVDCNTAACTTAYSGAEELDMFILGGTYFF